MQGALILDIETVGEEWQTIDEVSKAALTKWIADTAHSEEEYTLRLTSLIEGLGFSPLTGQIVALGVYDIGRHRGTVYYQDPTTKEEDSTIGAFQYKPRSEAVILTEFWEGVTHYETIVTFNGRAFDLPFIVHRSVVHGVTPTVDVLRYRYLTQQTPPYHVDLQDQLTFYGAMNKRPSLHLFCRAYGILSPKVSGVSGDDVAQLFREKKGRDIAQYNARDLIATAALYEKWQTYLAPPLFRKNQTGIDF